MNLASSLRNLPELRTVRLRIAPLQTRDAAPLQGLTDDPRITEAIDFLSSPFTYADALGLIAKNDGDGDRFLGLWELQTDALVGVFGVHLRDEDSIEIGYWVGSAYQGRGYALEAVIGLSSLLAIHCPRRRILAECRPENIPSWKVLTKAGFVPTGREGIRAGRKLLALPQSGQVLSANFLGATNR